MHRAFFRGFMAGTDDERAEVDPLCGADNPYQPGQTAKYWEHGYDAGVEELARCSRSARS